MESFVIFLREYKELLVSALCVLLSVIAILVKRRPKTLDDFMSCVDQVIAEVPSAICLVERPGDGPAKRKEVVDMCLDKVSFNLNRQLTDTETFYCIKEFHKAIEAVLETPQKKGVSK